MGGGWWAGLSLWRQPQPRRRRVSYVLFSNEAARPKSQYNPPDAILMRYLSDGETDGVVEVVPVSIAAAVGADGSVCCNETRPLFIDLQQPDFLSRALMSTRLARQWLSRQLPGRRRR